MVTEPQPSVAVATPVALVVVLAGHSSVRLAGAVMVGGVVSRTVMVCTPEATLPQPSVAVHRREMILLPPHVLLTESLKEIVTAPQPSLAVAAPVTLVATLTTGHSSVTFGGRSEEHTSELQSP